MSTGPTTVAQGGLRRTPASPIPAIVGDLAAMVSVPVAYCGGLGLTTMAALGGLFTRRGEAPSILAGIGRCTDRLVWPGLAIVTLVQASLGGFLAMQAFFGATFREGSGAVVGLGMLRNMGSLVAGWTLAAVCGSLFVRELRSSHLGLDGDELSVPDRDAARGLRADDRIAPAPRRLVTARVAAGALAGLVLSLWGAGIGIVCGLLAADSLLGVPSGMYVQKLSEMVVPFDLLSLGLKGLVFGAFAAVAACHEGLRAGEGSAPALVPAAVFRAVVTTLIAMSVLNGTYFTLAYLSGAPAGPVLAP
jgi:phospholipid/cholesterol/gamma-HCH transport system permease protein